jgi:orotate phosphoribosyltransferase
MGNTIEGAFEKGQRVILIEDLISTGGSSVKAVNALREGGLDVKGLAAIFTYGFKLAEENFSKEGCPIIALTNYEVLIEQALNSNYISQDDLTQLQSWRENPSTWMQED